MNGACRGLFKRKSIRIPLLLLKRVSNNANQRSGETKEETGLKLLNYNLEDLWVLARAITPTYQRLRFDTKFFVTSYNNFSNNIKGNGELHNLQFSYLEKALKLPLFDITEFLLEELLRKYNKEISEEFFPLFWRYKKNTRIISRPNNT